MSDQPLPPEWLARANRLAVVAALLSSTVHEVNNALQIISGSAEMLGPTTAADVVARRSEAIGGQARRASALLAELSAFARDDTPEGSSVDLTQVGQRALAMRQYTHARLNLQSTFEAPRPARAAAGSPRSTFQIVVNLVLNAERALAGRTGGRIAITVSEQDGRVQLRVDDNGPGLSAEAAARLFETSVAPASNALGIGLAVARWLAERQGGTLRHDASPLGGCAFTLALPPQGP